MLTHCLKVTYYSLKYCFMGSLTWPPTFAVLLAVVDAVPGRVVEAVVLVVAKLAPLLPTGWNRRRRRRLFRSRRRGVDRSYEFVACSKEGDGVRKFFPLSCALSIKASKPICCNIYWALTHPNCFLADSIEASFSVEIKCQRTIYRVNLCHANS